MWFSGGQYAARFYCTFFFPSGERRAAVQSAEISRLFLCSFSDLGMGAARRERSGPRRIAAAAGRRRSLCLALVYPQTGRFSVMLSHSSRGAGAGDPMGQPDRKSGKLSAKTLGRTHAKNAKPVAGMVVRARAARIYGLSGGRGPGRNENGIPKTRRPAREIPGAGRRVAVR